MVLTYKMYINYSMYSKYKKVFMNAYFSGKQNLCLRCMFKKHQYMFKI